MTTTVHICASQRETSDFLGAASALLMTSVGGRPVHDAIAEQGDL
jgi:hypothetical protein